MTNSANKSVNQRSRKSSTKPPRSTISEASLLASGAAKSKPNDSSKQDRLIAMLQSTTGVTIVAMMQATGWQQHSVRGFLAGVVRKKRKLKLSSKKVNGTRIYRIGGPVPARAAGSHSKRRAA